MKNNRGNSMQNLMKQANQMQLKLKKVQEELAEKEYTASAGGDGVVVTVRGSNKIVKIEVNPEVFSEGDREMLQDLIMTAANEALSVAKASQDEEMGKVTGGFNPGMF